MSAIVQVSDVTKSFDQTEIIHGLSFDVGQSEVFCLLGPSGCGKTTVLRLIAGFERPDQGRVFLKGEQVAGPGRWVAPEKRGVGMVFQDYALFPHLTVDQNVAFGVAHLPRAQKRAIVRTMLEMVGLADLAHRYPHELSGGQQQRVALARALAPCPVVLLLDEPFSNLDADMRAQMRLEVRRILKEARTTAIMVTHDQEEAFILADRVGVMDRGQLEQVDTPENIYHTPATRFVADFVGQADLIPGVLRGDRIVTELGGFPAPWPGAEGMAVKVVLRPDDVLFLADGAGEGVLVLREFRGSENLYSIQLPSGLVVRSSQPSTAVYSVGQRVTVQATLGHVVAFPEGPVSSPPAED